MLLQGDCLDLLPSIPDGSVDLVLCDLPYGTTKCKWDVTIPLGSLWSEYLRVAKENAAIVLFGVQPFTSILGASRPDLLRYSWVWEKTKATNFINAKRQPLRGFEDILVFYRKQPTYNPQGLLRVDRKVRNSGTCSRTVQDQAVAPHDGGVFTREVYTQEFTNYPRGLILEAENGRSDSVHPTQKPVPLLEYLIRTYTNAGETVLDNTMGSGSTGVACVSTGRKFVGMELDAGFYSLACSRIAAAGQVEQ